MPSPRLIRLAAVALVLSAVTTLLGYAVHPAPELASLTTSTWAISHLLLWVGALAGIAGVVGLSLRQREATASLGLIGGALAIAGLMALSGAYFYEALIVPVLASEVPALMRAFPGEETWGTYRTAVALSGALLGVGFLLLGIAMYRAAMLPRWAAVLATIGAIGAGVGFLLPRPVALLVFAVLGVGLVGLGYGLWTSPTQSESTNEPAREATNAPA
jgi:hypothetical protein